MLPAPQLRYMRTIAIANQKGGVGKTTTVQNVGAILSAEMGKRVLLVDMDAQGSLTASCGVSPNQTIADAIMEQTGIENVLYDARDGMTIAPANRHLADVEVQLYTKIGREIKLKNALATVAQRFDYCLIDCPPSLSLTTVNALTAANDVLIPTLPQMSDIRGMLLFFETVEEIKAINPSLNVLGVLLTSYDSRLNHHNSVEQAIVDAEIPLLEPKIGRSIRIAEAAADSVSVLEYDPTNKQLDAYRQLAEILING